MEHLKTKSLTGVILFLFLAFSLESYANDGIRVPYNFYEIEGTKNVHLFSDYNGNYVQVVDISNGARLEHKVFGVSSRQHKREFITSDKLDYGAFSLINGAFFNNNMSLHTDISFPFTPGNPVWKSTGENTRTLCIKNTKIAVIDKTGYNQRNYSLACTFSLTLLSPEVNKDRFNSLGRTYIGVSKDNTKVLFFISQSKTQIEMENMLRNWGIPNYHIIMGDGSASSQIVTKKNSLYGYKVWEGIILESKRSIPHTIQVFPY